VLEKIEKEGFDLLFMFLKKNRINRYVNIWIAPIRLRKIKTERKMKGEEYV